MSRATRSKGFSRVRGPSRGPAVERRVYPQAEAAQPWLAALLDAYHEIDRGVQEAMRREERQGRRLACGRGCAACCRTHQDIPVYPLELMGLSWYCLEELSGALRGRLRAQLVAYRGAGACPFLVDETCGVHPLRPMACRQFNVFDKVCAEGEDAFHTRRRDVMTPIARFTDAAFDRLLPFHGLKSTQERREAIRSGAVHALARPLRTLDWSRLAARLGETGSAPDSGAHRGGLSTRTGSGCAEAPWAPHRAQFAEPVPKSLKPSGTASNLS